MAGSLHPKPGSTPEALSWPIDQPGFELPWFSSPANLALATDEVHLWRATLDLPASVIERMACALSDEERARAGRIVPDQARARFVAGRHILRTVLGKYLELSAERVELTYGPHGKPELAPEHASGLLAFSLTHSHDLALVAVTLGRAIGVDVELLRPVSDVAGLVARVFSAKEQAEFRDLPLDRRLEGFFRGWTGKEAWLKAKSTGLTWPPDWFSVSLTSGAPMRLLDVTGDPKAPERWALASFTAAPGYLGALAVEGWGLRLASFHYSLASGHA
jgi:4'-phosphopantetheinyl transferase